MKPIPRVAWPLMLTTSRLVLGPVMLAIAFLAAGAGPWLVAGLYVALITDVLDGVVARHLNVATPALRRFDSQTDLIFWLCALGSAWAARPEVVRANLLLIGIMLALEAATYALSFGKFGREHSTHAYSAKAWGIVLVACFTAVLGFGESRYAFPILFITYVISCLDVVAILLILPRWQSDVPSCYHAWLIRRGVPFRRYKLFH